MKNEDMEKDPLPGNDVSSVVRNQISIEIVLFPNFFYFLMLLKDLIEIALSLYFERHMVRKAQIYICGPFW